MTGLRLLRGCKAAAQNGPVHVSPTALKPSGRLAEAASTERNVHQLTALGAGIVPQLTK